MNEQHPNGMLSTIGVFILGAFAITLLVSCGLLSFLLALAGLARCGVPSSLCM